MKRCATGGFFFPEKSQNGQLTRKPPPRDHPNCSDRPETFWRGALEREENDGVEDDGVERRKKMKRCSTTGSNRRPQGEFVGWADNDRDRP
jgi:hypothetical protein|eukprot:31137-Pelagococcus_subviridis.AAC.3